MTRDSLWLSFRAIPAATLLVFGAAGKVVCWADFPPNFPSPAPKPSSLSTASPLSRSQTATNAALRKADRSLEQKVTLTSGHICVGDLLERLSAQTGVPLYADDKEGAAGEEVIVCLKEVPLVDAMTGLASLFTYEKAPWVWLRDVDRVHPERSRYRLVRTEGAQQFAQVTKGQIQRQSEREITEAIDALNWTDEKQAEAAKTNHSIDSILRDPRSKGKLAGFAAALTSEQRLQSLRGQEFTLLLASAPKALADYARRETELRRKVNPGITIPDPEQVLFSYSNIAGLVPSVFAQIGDMGGFAVSGGMGIEKEWQKKIGDMWLGSEDTRTAPAAADQPLPDAPAATLGKTDSFAQMARSLLSGEPAHAGGVTLPLALLAVAERSGGSLLARQPVSYGISTRKYTTPKENTWNAWLSMISGARTAGDYKWHHGLALLTSHKWIQENVEADKVPWWIIKQMRADEATASHHLMPLETIYTAARRLTPAQLAAMNLRNYTSVDPARWQQPLFAEMDRSPGRAARFVSEGGVPFSAFSPETEASLRKQAASAGAPNATHVRLIVEDSIVPSYPPWLPPPPVLPKIRNREGDPPYSRQLKLQFRDARGPLKVSPSIALYRSQFSRFVDLNRPTAPGINPFALPDEGDPN